jgi:PTH1 family peptidyl-tRNA hydrolase
VKLVVGLGNPGRAYRWTRHNMGFWLVERFAQELGIDLSRRGLLSVYGRGKIGNEEIILAKPQTFMNLSGEAIRRLLHFFKVPPENLVVLHDDLDLPFGKIRIRLRGGHGGHQGVKSIVEDLGSDDFVRLKVGIGRPSDRSQDPADYVLEPLTGGEREEFKAAVERGLEALQVLLREGPQAAMDKFHPSRHAKA